MANGYGRLQIFATPAGTPLAKLICSHLSCELGDIDHKRHKDGEIEPQLRENVRDNDVFIIAPTHPPAENFFDAIWIAEAARLSSAARVTYVIPYLGYARADRKDAPRKAIGVRLALKALEIAKPDRFIMLDVHAEQSLATIEHAVFDHLYGSIVAVPYIRSLLSNNEAKNHVVAAPDHGAVQRAHKYARFLAEEGSDADPDIVILSKRRPRAGEVDHTSVKVIGDVKDKLVILADDMIDGGTTLMLGAQKLKEAGASGVWAFTTHPIFSENAARRIRKSALDLLVVTDSIWHDPKVLGQESGEKIVVQSCAPLLAQAIRRTHDGDSLSALIL